MSYLLALDIFNSFASTLAFLCLFSPNVPLASVSFSNCRRSKYLHPILGLFCFTHFITFNFFLIRIVGIGVQLGPLGTVATNRPIVPTPGDDDGEIGGIMIGRGNRSARRKPAPVPLCAPQTPHALPGREPRLPQWEARN
jgi:hypothetical protein